MDKIEKYARELCESEGLNPNLRLREYGQSSHSYWQWELYVPKPSPPACPQCHQHVCCYECASKGGPGADLLKGVQ